MIPVKTPDCNHRYYVRVPARERDEGDGGMHCLLTRSHVTSFWVVEHDDDLLSARGIYVEYTHMRPDTELGLGDSLVEADMRPYPFLLPDRAQTGMALTDDVRAYLLGGGRFIIRTFSVPPPPVMVWPA